MYLMYHSLLVIRSICSIMLQSLLLNEVKLTICLQKYMYNKINTCTYMYLHTVVDHYHADLTLYNNFNQSYEDCMHQYLMDTWKFI